MWLRVGVGEVLQEYSHMKCDALRCANPSLNLKKDCLRSLDLLADGMELAARLEVWG